VRDPGHTGNNRDIFVLSSSLLFTTALFLLFLITCTSGLGSCIFLTSRHSFLFFLTTLLFAPLAVQFPRWDGKFSMANEQGREEVSDGAGGQGLRVLPADWIFARKPPFLFFSYLLHSFSKHRTSFRAEMDLLLDRRVLNGNFA